MGLPRHERRVLVLVLCKPCAHMRPPEALRPGHAGWLSSHLWLDLLTWTPGREHIATKGLELLTVLAAGMWPKELWLDLGVSLCWSVLSPPFPLPRRERPPSPWPHLDAERGRAWPFTAQAGFMQLFHRLDSEARGCRAHGSGPWPARGPACVGECRGGEVFRDRCVLTGPGTS